MSLYIQEGLFHKFQEFTNNKKILSEPGTDFLFTFFRALVSSKYSNGKKVVFLRLIFKHSITYNTGGTNLVDGILHGFYNSPVTIVGIGSLENLLLKHLILLKTQLHLLFLLRVSQNNEKAFFFSVFKKTLVCDSNFLYSRKFSLVKLKG